MREKGVCEEVKECVCVWLGCREGRLTQRECGRGGSADTRHRDVGTKDVDLSVGIVHVWAVPERMDVCARVPSVCSRLGFVSCECVMK